jgi:phosphate starvation-inducible membrane PsiE
MVGHVTGIIYFFILYSELIGLILNTTTAKFHGSLKIISI